MLILFREASPLTPAVQRSWRRARNKKKRIRCYLGSNRAEDPVNSGDRIDSTAVTKHHDSQIGRAEGCREGEGGHERASVWVASGIT